MQVIMKRIHFVLVVLLIHLASLPITSAQENLPVITVNYRELKLVPEDIAPLVNKYEIFNNESSLKRIIHNNSTLFWEALGPIDSNLTHSTSLSTFAIVHINQSGFYQYLAMLTADNKSLVQLAIFQPDNENEFTSIIESATDFFARNDHYWGLCEEIVVIPGSMANMNTTYLWRLRFHLVAEGERWTLLLNSTASIVSKYSEAIPCQSCSDPFPVILGSSLLIAIGLAVTLILFRKKGEPINT